MAGIRKTLRIAEFRALLVSYVINRAGDVFGALALAIVVLGVTHSALATAALFLATQFLPGLVGPVLVARVGAIAPGRLLPACYVVEAVLFLVLAAVSRSLGVVFIIALAFVDGTLAFAARSVTRSTTASTLIGSDLMPEGKAAFNLALGAATVAGPVLAGAVLALFGPGLALAGDGVSFLLAAVLIVRTPGLRVASGDSGDSRSAGGPRGGRRAAASLRYVAGHPVLRLLVFGEGLAFVFFYLVVPVTVVYAARSLHAGSAGYAAILASWGAGAVIGSAVHVRLARRVGHATILLSTAAVAVAYVGTALAPVLVVACGASVLGGIGNGTQWASVETAVHGLVDEGFRLRVSALLESMAALAPGVGIILGGALTTLFSPRAAYLAAGLGLFALIGVAAFSRSLIAGPARDVAPALG
ncbi:MAG TPA: MFS transporter [Solirubrobacteraceae bacterium]|nr:MFS transporter [Solirubrobacteraceae bacterium]